MDMSTNAGIISNALKYVTEQKEELTALQKVDEIEGEKKKQPPTEYSNCE